ncbi:bifunctional methylenetetrahydrofolate dehydrogenase/methenyltetrahydrofolate cyclohydrolase [candidate division WOR-3 bacterium]|nr:bifunctional methylenetetrahydrofolate dehydrogenase/methenyltetrahydrofolate cyclohydrolase [candidate division WOR-3 bacterium]MCK4584270.1 bifunctional methylenetetrahydrofolate dehydrogenase/methenyltetrahydrofolate cyclohydrolase [candidate division WOR-3 bacterium]
MKTIIIDGRAIANEIREELSHTTSDLIAKNIIPRMAVLHIGEDPASLSYTKSIKKISSKLNIEVDIYTIEETTNDVHVIKEIKRLNDDKKIHGILIQEPIPSSFNREDILLSISPFKDIDCMNPINLGRVMRGEFPFAPSTPLGVLKVLEQENIDVEEKHVVIVGRSTIVGKPLANLLLIKGKGGNATVTVCHSKTRNLPFFTKMADVVVVAVGRPKLIKGDMLQQGAVVIDVGINDVIDKDGKHRLVGDVDFDSVIGIASYVTPVPGGVGPVTTLMLLSNLITAATRKV